MNFDLIGQNIIELDQVDSTNTFIKKNLSMLKTGDIVTAKMQLNGRGRLGSEWAADLAMLPVSVLLREIEKPTDAAILAPIAVSRTLEQLYDIPVYIKWSNDILAVGKKVCGILCESIIYEGEINIICGIGINLNQSNEFFIENALPHGASMLMLSEKRLEKEQILICLIQNLIEVFKLGFPALKDEYITRSATVGKLVKIIHGAKETLAKAVGIDDDGQLICEKDGKKFTVNSGEVHVRGIYGYCD